MTTYNKAVKSVLENNELIELVKDDYYFELQENVFMEIEATFLDIEEIGNVSTMEHKIYAYLKKQGLELLKSEMKYTTALVNYPCYKAINLETSLLRKENANERLFSLAHELGHYLDVKFNHSNDALCFNIYYNDNMRVMEAVAWAYGWKVLEALGCTLKDEYFKTACECLDTYIRNMDKTIKVLTHIDLVVEKYENMLKERKEMVVS